MTAPDMAAWFRREAARADEYPAPLVAAKFRAAADTIEAHQRTVDELLEALERSEMMMRMRGHIDMADECAALIAKHRKGG